MNSITYFVQNFMDIIFSPLIIFSGIYITALAIYSIKGKKSPNYIYNINFFGYILGITVTSVVLSFSLISLILVIKKELYLDVFILLIAIISFTILCLLLTKFIKLIKLDDKTIVTTNKKEQQELRIEYLKIFRTGFKQQLQHVTVIDKEGQDVTPEKLKKEKERLKKC